MENLINYESILNAAINKDSNAIKDQIVHLTPEILNNFLDKIDSLHEKCYPIIANYFSILTDLDSEKTVELLIDVERLSEIQWVRMKVSWIFVEIIKESATKKLISLVNEKKDDDSWDYALDYLVNIGDPKAKDPLFFIFSERKGKRKEEIAIALGKLGDSRVFDTLISANNNTDSKDRGEIVNAFGQIKDNAGS